jgi:hypothetical protein
MAQATAQKRHSGRIRLICLLEMVVVLVELSGIEPLTSSLRIQDTTSDGETPDDTK